MVVKPDIKAISFDEKSDFNIVVGFTPGWDYKDYIENTSQKILNLSTTNKKNLKYDVTDGIVVNGSRQPILHSFALDKLSEYEIISEPETVHNERINKSVLNTITSYLEGDNNKKLILIEKR